MIQAILLWQQILHVKKGVNNATHRQSPGHNIVWHDEGSGEVAATRDGSSATESQVLELVLWEV